MTTLQKVEKMLQEAADKRTWGNISIDLKDGKPLLIKQTIQTRAEEDYPYGNTFRK